MKELFVACASLVLAAVPALAQETPSSAIVTQGEAIVRRAPDQAHISVVVDTRARDPKDAQRKNAEVVAAVQQRLMSAGIPKDALRTFGYIIHQEFDTQNGRRVPRDYVARNALEVRLDAIARTGEIIDAAVQAGATSISGVRFDLKDRAGAEREALRLAVADARGRAEAAAAGAGRAIDRVVRIEDVREPIVMPPPRPMVLSRAAAEAPQETPIEPGQIEIQARVSLTVSLK